MCLNGTKIRQLRNIKGYTAEDIEKLSKSNKYGIPISKTYLQELERGDKMNPTFSKIEVIADILGCKIDELRLSKVI